MFNANILETQNLPISIRALKNPAVRVIGAIVELTLFIANVGG